MVLAARGMSDREIARVLDCSLRTVTRRFSDAMTHYGARSRFHLGFAIATTPDEPQGDEDGFGTQRSGVSGAMASEGSALASSMPSMTAISAPVAVS